MTLLKCYWEKTILLLLGLVPAVFLGGCTRLGTSSPVSPLGSPEAEFITPHPPLQLGGQVLFHRQPQSGKMNVFVMDLQSGELTRLTNEQGNNYDPAWSPDGQRIAFISDRDQHPPYGTLWLMNADGSEQHALLDPGKRIELGPTWSPDGTRIAFQSNHEGNPDILVLNLESGELNNLTNHPNVDANPAWSPDGMQVAFASDRSGNPEIWIANVDGTGLRQVTQRPMLGDWRPAWSPDGQRLIFESYPTVPPRQLYIQCLDKEEHQVKAVSNWNTWPTWISDDMILYAASETYDENTQTPSPANLYIQDLRTSDIFQLTSGPDSDGRPSWKP